jgi:hypothetical protein
MYVRMAGPSGVSGFLGVLLLAVAWIFLGVFLSLYGVLVAPWLAEKAPALLAPSVALPGAFIVAFVTALVAQLVGTLLLAVPFIRGRVQPRWAGIVLPTSAIVAIAGDLITPSGPAANVYVNLLSNLGPVLLVSVLGFLGFRMWSETCMRPPVGTP